MYFFKFYNINLCVFDVNVYVKDILIIFYVFCERCFYIGYVLNRCYFRFFGVKIYFVRKYFFYFGGYCKSKSCFDVIIFFGLIVVY